MDSMVSTAHVHFGFYSEQLCERIKSANEIIMIRSSQISGFILCGLRIIHKGKSQFTKMMHAGAQNNYQI